MPTPSFEVSVALGDWKRGTGPLLARLATALDSAIARGSIPSGARMPSERDLARDLHLSRSTVVAAYDRLKGDNRVHTLRGSGTYAGPASSGRAARFLPGRLLALVDQRPGVHEDIEFTIAALPGSREMGPAGERMAKHLGRLARETPGYLPLGLPVLRREIAKLYADRGLPTEPEQIVVTSGAQQAIALVAQLFRGERVGVEDPTNPASIDAFRAAGADIVPIGVDHDGACVDELGALPAGMQPRAVYVASTFNNPTGTVLSLERRRTLLVLARRWNWTLVEDETLCDISLRDEPAPPLMAALDTGADVITIGSACKLFWGGLRIGWLRASAATVDQIAPLKIVADLGTSLVGQALCAEVLPLRERVRAERREQLAVRFRALGDALNAHLPSWQWDEPRGGSSLWIELPFGDSATFAQSAARYGVTIAPGSVFSSADRHARFVRLPFVLAPDVLRSGVERLTVAWEAYAPRARALEAVV